MAQNGKEKTAAETIIRSKCKRCGAELRDPRSLRRGYGPVCWRRVRVEATKRQVS